MTYNYARQLRSENLDYAFMRYFMPYLKWLTLSLGLLAGLCQADSSGKDTSKFFDIKFPEHFWSKNICRTKLALITPRMMSNHQLLSAVESFNDRGMLNTHRLLNNLWLSVDEREANHEAVELGELLSFGYFSYRRALTDQELDNPFQFLYNPHNESSVITHMKGYDLELSGRTVMLSLKRSL